METKHKKITGIETLRGIAWLFLIAAIILGVHLIFAQTISDLPKESVDKPLGTYNKTLEIVGIITGITCWAFFLVVCTIAESLINIREKLNPELIEENDEQSNNSEEVSSLK